jgi:predicted transcriptional regulator
LLSVFHKSGQSHTLCCTIPRETGRMEFGMRVDSERLKQLREEKVLTMRQVAELSGVSRDTVYRLEHGLTGGRQSSIKALARVYGVAPQELLANGKP